jgi:tripartite-type tricarboxylate transporter receptor subunit TctC
MWGILATAGTPAPIVDRLSNEIKAILTLDEVKKWFLKDGAEPGYLAPTEFTQFLVQEMTNWARVVKKANIKLEN